MNAPSADERGGAAAKLAPLLALLSALGPFSIDAYLPAFPAMAAGLHASPLEIQQTLTAYLATFAAMILWHGPLSDAHGRRRVILISLALFSLASLLCLAAASVEMLWLGRALQGATSGAGMVVGRTIIRDLFQGADAQRMMARVAIMFALAPAIAPIIGGWIFTWFGWRAVFGFLVLFGLGLLLLCWRQLPETLPPAERHTLQPKPLLKAYGEVFSHPQFMALTSALSLIFCGFFIYVLSAPAFLIQHLGLAPHQFGYLFVPTVCGMMLGSTLSGRLAGRLSRRRTIVLGFGVMAAAALLNLILNLTLPPGVPQSLLHLFVFNLGLAMAMPSLTLLAVDLFPTRRGLVSSCQSFIQSSTNSLAAGTLAPLLWHSPLSLAWGMIGFLTLGGLCFSGYVLLHRRHPT